jgi:hypothetical protein
VSARPGNRAGTTSKSSWGEAVTAEQVNCKTGDLLEALLGGTEGGEQAVGMTATTAHRQTGRDG